MSTCDTWYYIFSVVLTVVFYGALIFAIQEERPELFAIMSVWVIYGCWSCCCNDTTKYIRGLCAIDLVYKCLSNSIKAKPTVHFHIQCYHTVRRRIKTKSGYHTRTSRVNTHSADMDFVIKEWKD